MLHTYFVLTGELSPLFLLVWRLYYVLGTQGVGKPQDPHC